MGYYEELKKFLEQANTSNLKTKHYKSEYPNIKVKVNFGQGVFCKNPMDIFFERAEHHKSWYLSCLSLL